MQVSILGTGEMGSRMAAALLRAGHAVTVWNRTSDRASALVGQGARLAKTPAEAVEAADAVIAVVRDDDASRRVWLAPDDGALTRLSGNAVAIESSTLSLGWVRDLSAICTARGVPFLDAPVVGSRAQADAAQLIHLVGGEPHIVARMAPVFAAIGGAAHHAGPSGAGAALKLIVNAMLGVQVAMMAELLGAAHRFGLDPVRAVAILAQTPPCSPAAKIAAQAILARSFAPAFPVDLMEKDLHYVADTAPAGALPVTAAARQVFASAQKAGFGAENMNAVAKLYL